MYITRLHDIHTCLVHKDHQNEIVLFFQQLAVFIWNFYINIMLNYLFFYIVILTTLTNYNAIRCDCKFVVSKKFSKKSFLINTTIDYVTIAVSFYVYLTIPFSINSCLLVYIFLNDDDELVEKNKIKLSFCLFVYNYVKIINAFIIIHENNRHHLFVQQI